jgi:flagellar hook protein FlgE
MSLFSSLYTGASGMHAQAKSTGIIANNVANINTTGYKRSEASFKEIYSASGTTNESPGMGVVATKINRITDPGSIKNTSSLLDAGIIGNGFFAVKASPHDTGNSSASPFMYTRAGQFDIFDTGNGEAFLRNANGMFLYGVQANQGNTPGSITASSLVPIQINPGLMEIVAPTSTGRLLLNLDARASDINTHMLTAPYNMLPVSSQATLSGTSVVDNSQPAHFSRSIEMYDAQGNANNISFEYRKITGPHAHATSNAAPVTGTTSLLSAPFQHMNAGDSFSITSGGVTQEYIIGAAAGTGQVRIDTVGDLVSHLSTQFGGGSLVEATIDSSNRFVVYAKDPAGTFNFTEITGNPLTGPNSLSLIADPQTGSLNYIADPAAYAGQGDFPAMGGNVGAQHYWEVRVLGPADPVTGIKQEITKGLINFANNGTLNVADPANVNMNLNMTYAGSTFSGPVSVDMRGFTQYGGEYTVLTAEQNGAPRGERTGIEISNGGKVYAKYSNGQNIHLYSIPLANFVGTNFLAEENGTAFTETEASGRAEFSLSGQNGVGTIYASSLESSNVDLANEFAEMIVSQRAYGAASKIITTVDQMTQYLAQLSR